MCYGLKLECQKSIVSKISKKRSCQKKLINLLIAMLASTFFLNRKQDCTQLWNFRAVVLWRQILKRVAREDWYLLKERKSAETNCTGRQLRNTLY